MESPPCCLLCAADVFHCHEVSTAHADGTTTCGDPWCSLPHHLHEWQVRCGSAAAAPCACTADPTPAAPVQSGGRRYTDTWLSLAS